MYFITAICVWETKLPSSGGVHQKTQALFTSKCCMVLHLKVYRDKFDFDVRNI
jgi:hypothetical protein